jgi:cytochrome c556
MKTLLHYLSLGLVLTIGISAPTIAHNGEPHSNKKADKNILYRQSAFTMVKYHFAPLGGMVKGKVPYDAAKATANAEAVAAISKLAINGFTMKSLSEKSEAKAEIWEDWLGFEKEMQAFEKAAANLAANAGDFNSMKAAFKETAKTCKSCHKGYRKKKK